MQISTTEIILDEKEAQAAFDSIMGRSLSEGKKTQEFEEKLAKFLGRKFVICTPSGSAALMLAMMGINICHGDEVIVPDCTFIATAHAPKLLGANVVLADTKEDVPLLNVDATLKLITSKTKAIIPVHLNGRRADTKLLKEKIKGSGIYIVDDACQAMATGIDESHAGNDADIACYSFSVPKIMTTGQGGFLATDDEFLYTRMKKLKTHGMGIDNIFESSAYPFAGFNFKYADILAAVGLVQLNRMKAKINTCKKNYEIYVDGIAGLDSYRTLPIKDDEVVVTPELLCDKVPEVRKYLCSKGIQTRPAAACLHHAEYLERRMEYKNATYFSEHIVYLPGGPNQPRKNIEETIRYLREAAMKI